ncbi:hypothetical protein [uncultured Winogradskyella sp.]|uniref:hypothetical protein n=1 Tax=uncultured Winogradskyella sp. TaxID=395353 RepID=UPI0030DCD0F9|tara:strand:+ start:100861 stop:101316 length:456 start_codon:yes stop_codon:yes gene_type:complete
MAGLFAELLEWFLDIKFWFKKRKRRKFEKEHNLPKRIMIYPSDKILLVSIGLGLLSILCYFAFYYPKIIKDNTEEKLLAIVVILEEEKRILGFYPAVLNDIIRNNPLRKNITKDAFNFDIQYQLIANGERYLLFSVGKDGVPNSKDDIVIK